MKPTLNEEIGMSQKAIDYVNSLEVKEPKLLNNDVFFKGVSNRLPEYLEEIEQKRIRREALNAWICIAIIIVLTLIFNWK